MFTESPAPRRVDCHYLVSAWSGATEAAGVEPTVDEHDLLDQATAALFACQPIVPREAYAPDPLPPGFLLGFVRCLPCREPAASWASVAQPGCRFPWRTEPCLRTSPPAISRTSAP